MNIRVRFREWWGGACGRVPRQRKVPRYRSVVVATILVAFVLLVVGGMGTVQASERADVVDATPEECDTLSAGSGQSFEFVVDYDLDGKHPSHITVGVSEDGYGHEVTEFDISDRGSNDQVVVSVDRYIGTDWEQAVASISVYAEGETSSSANDKVYYDVDGSTTECEPDPEEITVRGVNEDDNGLSSAYIVVQRLSDGEQQSKEADNDGFATFDDQTFLDSGAYRVHLYPKGGYPPYYGYTEYDLANGESAYIRLERGGVYIRDHSASGTFDSSDTIQVQSGDSLPVDLDLYRPRNGDSATVQTYITEVGTNFDDVPDDEQNLGSVPSGPSTETVDVPVPTEPGEYKLRFDVESTFTDIGESTRTDIYNGPTFEVVELTPPNIVSSGPESERQTIVGAETLEFSIDADSPLTTDLSITWQVDGHEVSTGRTMVMDGRKYENGEYNVTATVSDGYDETEETTETWAVTVEESKPPTLERISPVEETINPTSGETVRFAVDGSTEHGGELTYTWAQDGDEIGTGPELEQTFNQAGTYTITARAEDEWGQTSSQRWTVDVESFRDAPSVSSTASAVSLEVTGSAEFMTVSIRNPDVNTRNASVEAIVEPPDGVEVRGVNGDTTDGDAATRVLLSTIEPGEQKSMRLEVAISDDALDGKRIEIPYDVTYYPSSLPDDYHTKDSGAVEVAVGDVPAKGSSGGLPNEADGSPGFSTPMAGLALLILLGWVAKPTG